MTTDYSEDVSIVIRRLDEQLTAIAQPYEAQTEWIASWWDSEAPASGVTVMFWAEDVLYVDPFPRAATVAYRDALARLGDRFYPDAPSDVVDDAFARLAAIMLRHRAMRSRDPEWGSDQLLLLTRSLATEALRAMAAVRESHRVG